MSAPSPYYDDGICRIYHGDCRIIVPRLRLGPAVVVTDPPYGVSEPTNRAARGRSNLAACNDFPPVYGDEGPFDPSWLVALFDRMVLFGANYYADKLPPSPGWIVWDKRDGLASNDNADCELAWSSVQRPARIYRHMWSGMIKASERDERRVHPTQKPVSLMSWVIRQHSTFGDTILDPYMGSGSVLRAAKDIGRQAIGVEIEERYCEVTAKRLSQESLPFSGEAV